MIYKYDDYNIVYTNCDPKIDLLNWFDGLRSREYTADLLKETHGFKESSIIKSCSAAIASHAEFAVNLLKNGLSTPAEICFLPLYYGALNIAKICIICSGQYDQLIINKWHGALYKPTSKFPKFIQDKITIKQKGAIPLYYESITNTHFPRTAFTLKTESILPFIRRISHEMLEIYGIKDIFTLFTCNMKQNLTTQKARLMVKFISNRPSSIREIKAFVGFKRTKNGMYQTKEYDLKNISKEEIMKRHLRKWLFIHEIGTDNKILNMTYICRKHIIFPEEFATLLILFYMSNVVRYNPEYLNFLRNSKAWTVISVLQNHAIFSYLNSCWSFIKKKTTLFQLG